MQGQQSQSNSTNSRNTIPNYHPLASCINARITKLVKNEACYSQGCLRLKVYTSTPRLLAAQKQNDRQLLFYKTWNTGLKIDLFSKQRALL